jgi:hypothetical protein
MPGPPPPPPVDQPLPAGTFTVSGTIVSAAADLPLGPANEFGVILRSKTATPLEAHDCLPGGVTPPTSRNRTFAISNVAPGEYVVLAFRRAGDQFERTSASITVVDRDVTTPPIQLLNPLDADDRDGPGEENVLVTWSAPNPSSFSGHAFLMSSSSACGTNGDALTVTRTYQTLVSEDEDPEHVKVVISNSSTGQVAIRVRNVDTESGGGRGGR